MVDHNANNQDIRVLIWNEHRHEKKSPEIAAIYPDGIHGAIATGLELRGLSPETTTLDDPHQGLPEGKLAETDVLIWRPERPHQNCRPRSSRPTPVQWRQSDHDALLPECSSSARRFA